MNINKNEKWYEREPQTITEKDNITILCDMPMHTDCEIKPTDKTLESRTDRKKNCPFIYMTIPTEKNISVQVNEKLSKCRDLESESERMLG